MLFEIVLFVGVGIVSSWLLYYYFDNYDKDILNRPISQQKNNPEASVLIMLFLTLPFWIVAKFIWSVLTLVVINKADKNFVRTSIPFSTIYWSGESQQGKCLEGGKINFEKNKGLSFEIHCKIVVADMPDTIFIYMESNVYKGALSGIYYNILDNGYGNVVCKALHSTTKIELRVTPTKAINSEQ